MRGEQAIFNLEIKKRSGLSINPDIHHSKVFSSDVVDLLYFKLLILSVQIIKGLLQQVQKILGLENVSL